MIEFPTKLGQTPKPTTSDFMVSSRIPTGYAMAVGTALWSDDEEDYDVMVMRVPASDAISVNTFGSTDRD